MDHMRKLTLCALVAALASACAPPSPETCARRSSNERFAACMRDYRLASGRASADDLQWAAERQAYRERRAAHMRAAVAAEQQQQRDNDLRRIANSLQNPPKGLYCYTDTYHRQTCYVRR